MNNVLQLKGRFEKRKNDAGFGKCMLPRNTYVLSNHVRKLKEDLERLKAFWLENTDIDGTLISVHYTRVVAKSNRLRVLLSDVGKNPVDSIRGVKFITENDAMGNSKHKHVFTHYIQISALEKAIEDLEKTDLIITEGYGGKITDQDTDNLGTLVPYRYQEIMSKTRFLKCVVDCFFVEKFDLDVCKKEVLEESIITLYRTDVETKELLKRFGIEILNSRILGDITVLLDKGQLQTLYKNAPYLISMSVSDFTKINLEDINSNSTYEYDEISIPDPTDEPVVGVIDTQFNEQVYFHKWVNYKNRLSKEIELQSEDFKHGTAVTSIIVDGPKGNPMLDDGCGRFRVRHFGVATNKGFSSFSILREIRDIVSNNQDIKVWNLSLGSMKEIEENFISPEAAELDQIQNDYDVIFVVAGTNKPFNMKDKAMKMGAPADSLNALVVNAVQMNDQETSYTRTGPVLSFFHKPDISYYGGDGVKENEKMAVCVDDLGVIYTAGTSYAAPWIARKLAYLICVMGFNREVAKALLIDAAAKWEDSGVVSDKKGYGVVPKRIEDILTTPDDEIKFFISGIAEDYETYNYNLPVPVVNGNHPFYARAVLCYFPQCDRNEGVDYTSTEMDIHFGRVQENGKLKSIDDNKQSEEGVVLYEEEARNIYRKWDNVKRICEQIKKRKMPRKSYGAGMWGIKIITKDRISSKNRKNLQFGIIITLKEMEGVNRIDEFIKSCMAHGWIVNRIDVQNQIDIYSVAEEEIKFE